jgi:hypothetical protein
MREIPYVTRPQFLPIIERQLNHLRNSTKDLTVQISLEPGGYNGDVIEAIHSGDAHTFETDWPHRDHTRFPQRIRVAAIALQQCGFIGLFRIIHEDGVLIIRAI